MFGMGIGIGKNFVNGAIEEIKKKFSGFDISNIGSIPLFGFIADYWKNLPDEKKKEYTDIVVKALMKALASYAK